ncbi:MAG: hypothetical protein HN389_05495 [Clostridia bacterium]|nr:hypothetical protein [Clostridia bacterium]
MLWIGLEAIGATIGVLAFGISVAAYIIALLFGALGGVISMALSVRGLRKVASLPPSVKLASPCTVQLYRDDSDVERSQSRYFSLNNDYIGALDNDAMLQTATSRSQNLLTSRSGYEASNEASLAFEAPSGGTVEIHIAGGVFAEDKTKVVEPD